MKNLAGDKNCDPVIEQELLTAGITVVRHPEPLKQEVPATITGELSDRGMIRYKFTRAWSYWVVKGRVPILVAQRMYEAEVGKTAVRVAGHAASPPPVDPWVEEFKGALYVDTYHIDSQEGLNLFVDAMLQHDLVDSPLVE